MGLIHSKPRRGAILVTGATGRQGGAVAKRLLAGNFEVRAMTRYPDSASARRLAELGADVIAGDFNDPLSLARALVQVSGVFAMQTPYETGTDQEEIHGIRLVEAASEAGIEQFVYSSVASADLPTGVAHFESKGRIERSVRAAGFPYATILRPTFFMEMLLSAGNLRALAAGRIAMTFDRGTRVAMIAVEDIAEMAMAVFSDPIEWNGEAVTLAGDTPSFTEVAAALGEAISRPISYMRIPPKDLDPETRPKLGTQNWLASEGWKVNLAGLRASYPFKARTIKDWAVENAAALGAARVN